MSPALVATILCAVIAAGGPGCRHQPDAGDHHPAAEAGPQAEVGDGTDHVTLGVEAAARAGIRSALAERAEGTTAIAAFGRVLDPLPLVEGLHARAAARNVAAVARGEYERVSRLHREDQNASARDLEAARAALDKATQDLAVATARLGLGWGAWAEQGEAFADDLVAGRAALVRVDLPAGVTVNPPPTSVTVAAGHAPIDPTERREARVLGPATTTDPLLQGEGYFALVVEKAPRPGSVLSVTVPRDAVPVEGVAVPPRAVVWIDAHAAVYIESSPGRFERRTVTLGPRLADRWIVTAGVGAGDRVVVEGAAVLLSSQIVGVGPATD